MAVPDILDVQVTENDVANTTTETDLLSYTVPANTLGTNKALRILIRSDYLNNSGVGRMVTWKVKYGATTMYHDDSLTSVATDASRRGMTIDLILWARNATNSQGLGGNISLGGAGLATVGIGNVADDEVSTACPLVGANASEDSTAAKDLKITVKHSFADTTISVRRLYSCIELLAV